MYAQTRARPSAGLCFIVQKKLAFNHPGIPLWHPLQVAGGGTSRRDSLARVVQRAQLLCAGVPTLRIVCLRQNIDSAERHSCPRLDNV